MTWAVDATFLQWDSKVSAVQEINSISKSLYAGLTVSISEPGLSSSILCSVSAATEQAVFQKSQTLHHRAPLYFQWQDSGFLLLL